MAATRERQAQVERTLLAWHRTALLGLGNAALLARAGVVRSDAWPLVLAAVVTLGALTVRTAASHRYQHLGNASARGLVVRDRRVPATASGTAAIIAVAALVLVATG